MATQNQGQASTVLTTEVSARNGTQSGFPHHAEAVTIQEVDQQNGIACWSPFSGESSSTREWEAVGARINEALYGPQAGALKETETVQKVDQQNVIASWLPIDDGIVACRESSSTSEWEAVDAMINEALYGPQAGEVKASETKVDRQNDITTWSPVDDGIVGCVGQSSSTSDSATREAMDAEINEALYGPRRKHRLAVFREICPE